MSAIKAFYYEQQERLKSELRDADPLSEAYIRGMRLVLDLDTRLADDGYSIPDETPAAAPETCESEAPADEAPAAETPEAPAEEEAHPVYERSYVRGRLADARSEKGINIAEIFDRLGYKNFSAVPETEYWRLMEELDKALEDKK